MLNNGGPRYKRSSLEKQMNQDVIWCVLTLVILCVIGAIGCKLWLNAYYHVGEPFISDRSKSHEAFLAFWTYVIILQVSFFGVLLFYPSYFFLIPDFDTVIPVCNFGNVQNYTSVSYPQRC